MKEFKLIILAILVGCSSGANKVKNQASLAKQNTHKKKYVVPDYYPLRDSIYPGFAKKLLIPVGSDWKNITMLCNNKRVGLDKVGQDIRAYVSAKYDSKEKSVSCQMKFKRDGIAYSVETAILKISSYPYKVEKINVKKKHVELSKKSIDRWLREKKRLEEVYAAGILERALFQDDFVPPLKSKITSLYGGKRVFNNKKESWHSGVDFRARTGTAIPTTNRGRVVFTGHLFFNGKTVIVDHGLGIMSMYCHLSKIEVVEGEVIPKRGIVGKAGNTGRSSAPHLHWGLRVQGNWVNGLSIINQ